MKLVTELTSGDFEAHPVWVALNNDFREYEPRQKKGSAPLLSLVSTSFLSADGTEYSGFGTVTKLAWVNPVLFVGQEQVPIHFSKGQPTEVELTATYAKLKKTPTSLFPISFEINVPVKYKPVWTTVESFTFWSLDGPGEIR